MADKIQDLLSRFNASSSTAQTADGQDKEHIARANGVVDKRRRLSETASPLQLQMLSQSKAPISESSILRQLNYLFSDSDDYDLEGYEADSDFEAYESEEEEEVDDVADDVPEAQHQYHHVTDFTPTWSPAAIQASSGSGSRSCSAVVHEAIPVLLTDPYMLNCSICNNPLCSPIFQCDYGHLACSSCRSFLKNQCSSCLFQVGFSHSRAFDKLIESMRVECKNKKFGCKETLIYHKKSDHEKTCPHSVCFCPISFCGFASSSKDLYRHFSNSHATSATSFSYGANFHLNIERLQMHVILQERNEGVIFILNHDIQEHGSVFNVDCLGPERFKNAFVYQISFKWMETCLSLESSPEVCAKRQQHTPDKIYLTIPSLFSGCLVQVCIKKAHPVV